MRTNKIRSQKHHDCNCKCHETTKEIDCCECYEKGYEDCLCGEHIRCCGDKEKPKRPKSPKAPGWEPGDLPAKNPLTGAKDDEDRYNKFRHAIIDIIRDGSSLKGPKFGKRKDEYLPYLLIRANAGDRGSRPLTTVFWESPDIFIAPDTNAETAPEVPSTLGGVAKAGALNTIWAHVWNLGRAPVYNARVEFYWFNPTFGFNEASANFIGVTYVDLGDRGSGNAHKYVKCPVSWIPTYTNGGHECLMVRVFEPLTDPLTDAQWNASNDRHVGQRNISVINSSSPAVLELNIRLGCNAPQGRAEIQIQESNVEDFKWLSILENKRDHGYKNAKKINEIVGFTYPTLIRPENDKPTLQGIALESLPKILKKHVKYDRGCDELEILFYVFVDGLKAKECRIYRLNHLMNGKLIGGYTVVVRKQ